MTGASRIVLQALLFLAAFVVFNTALFFGLQVSPNLGSVLLVVAALIAFAGIAWIVLSAENRQRATILALLFVAAFALLWVGRSGIDPLVSVPLLATAAVIVLGSLGWVVKSSRTSRKSG